jgi:hypothetical protein
MGTDTTWTTDHEAALDVFMLVVRPPTIVRDTIRNKFRKIHHSPNDILDEAALLTPGQVKAEIGTEPNLLNAAYALRDNARDDGDKERELLFRLLIDRRLALNAEAKLNATPDTEEAWFEAGEAPSR